VAVVLSDVLGRHITHEKVSVTELAVRLMAYGVPKEYADMLAAFDAAIAQGSEAKLNDRVREVTGRSPRRLREFAEENRGAWL
jgi:hypothetical protein